MLIEQKTKDFLTNFPASVMQILPDHNKKSKKHLNRTVLQKDFSKELAISMQKQGAGIFFSVNGFKGGHRTASNLICINAVFIDLDFCKEEHGLYKWDREELRAEKLRELGEFILPPHFIISTKNGLHVIWLTEGLNDVSIFKSIQTRLVQYFNADRGSMDISRVLRLPESIHQKKKSDPYLCEIAVDNSSMPRYRPEVFLSNY